MAMDNVATKEQLVIIILLLVDISKTGEQTAKKKVLRSLEKVGEIKFREGSKAISTEEGSASPEKMEEVSNQKEESFVIGNVQELIVLNVLAPTGSKYHGRSLVEAMQSHGLKYGDMNIFHRIGEDGTPEFSLASAIEPGTFDISKLASEKITGITMFMHVHKLVDPEAVYNKMLAVAETIAADLGGLIKDESRSVITAQTIEHCRQEIRDFQFRHSA